MRIAHGTAGLETNSFNPAQGLRTDRLLGRCSLYYGAKDSVGSGIKG
jgi:hypothetical protein